MSKITAVVCMLVVSLFMFSMPAFADRANDMVNRGDRVTTDRGADLNNDMNNNDNGNLNYNDTNYNDRGPATRNVSTANDNDRDTNWQWLGLLGLVGLFGLKRRDREEVR
ncbi:WGxxGxxG family protein [Fictibacillus fluitans]|uniref:WGxxGxxG family protein n=1 Tax=Fictibacillus fluitans TaxID=3058422 RepID=A0ABT8HZ52_9BACL|nr:WGxxGxxG family protein [Fictibacillus sp. NE201]MDN4526026.1 WGxxGxxG family protein [Fictibacillus sp. NE201]